MRTAILFPPDRRVQRCRAIRVLSELPAWPLVRQKVHVQYAPATARAKHRRLFEKAVFLDDVDYLCSERFGKRFLHRYGAIGCRLLSVIAAYE